MGRRYWELQCVQSVGWWYESGGLLTYTHTALCCLTRMLFCCSASSTATHLLPSNVLYNLCTYDATLYIIYHQRSNCVVKGTLQHLQDWTCLAQLKARTRSMQEMVSIVSCFPTIGNHIFSQFLEAKLTKHVLDLCKILDNYIFKNAIGFL